MSGLTVRLQRAAERMAKESFDEHVDELAALADGDLEAVHEAIRGVATTATTAGTAEHIAFTLLAAAWKRIAEERRRAMGRPAGRPDPSTTP